MKNLSNVLNKITDKLVYGLQSNYLAPVLLCYGVFCWVFSLTALLVVSFCAIFVLILCFCKDVKNIFSMVLFVPFFIESIEFNENWGLYITAIGSAIVALISFFVKTVVLQKKKLRLGEMFLGFCLMGVALLLGGISKFSIINFLITLALFFATYLLYFIIINCTKDFKKYLINIFILGNIVLSFVMIIACFSNGVFDSEFAGRVVFLGAEHVNVFSEYLLIGIIFAFYISLGKKCDWGFFLIALFFEGIIFLTRCRMIYLLSALAIITLFIISFIKSPNKKTLTSIVGIILILLCIIIIVYREHLAFILEPLYAKMRQQNGRELLWPWCMELFKERPYFGVGFVSDGPIPTVYNYVWIILAHNTVIQWLTSLGVIGTALITYFYLQKYKIAFRKMTCKKFVFITSIIGVALAGITDQAPTMDFFMFFIPLGIIASIENEERESDSNKVLY